MSRRVAFLRGINLGAQRRVPMQDLRKALERAGYEEVRTLLQSGNVVLASAADPAALERDLAATLHATFAFEIAVLVRTRDELAEVIARDPFGEIADDPARYQVSLSRPSPSRLASRSSSAGRSPPSASPCGAARSTGGTRTGSGAPSWPS